MFYVWQALLQEIIMHLCAKCHLLHLFTALLLIALRMK
jgi:hypothetical protein